MGAYFGLKNLLDYNHLTIVVVFMDDKRQEIFQGLRIKITTSWLSWIVSGKSCKYLMHIWKLVLVGTLVQRPPISNTCQKASWMWDKSARYIRICIWLRDPVGTIYIRVREPVGTMGARNVHRSRGALQPPPRLLRETQRPAPEHVVLCGNVRGCALCCAAMCASCRQSRVGHWLLLGAAGQRSNPSVCCRLPAAVFHLSTPVRPSCWSPNHPQSLQMLQLWNHQFCQLAAKSYQSKESCVKKKQKSKI